MKDWNRPAVAGWWMGQPVRFRLRGSREWKQGTIADVHTDGNGKATALSVAVTPDERPKVPISRVEPIDDVLLSGTPRVPPLTAPDQITANAATAIAIRPKQEIPA